MPTMKRAAKRDGVGNIVVEQVESPKPGEREVLVQLTSSLISRGSEIGGRYLSETAVDPARMGYSASGVVVELGPGVTEMTVGDRVGIVAPHSEYVVGQLDPATVMFSMVPIPDDVTFEAATFLPLIRSSIAWADTADIGPSDSVAILGQGLVGSLMLQVVRQRQTGQIIAIDGLDLRCDLARQFGADAVINCSNEDPVASVRKLCPGGANIVIDCVGGLAGVKSFAQAQEMTAGGGKIQLIGLYHREPLPLDASKIMGKLVIGGIRTSRPLTDYMKDAVDLLRSGAIRTRDMVTHRFRLEQAKDAFDLLVDRLGETLGVVFEYD